MYRPKGWIAVAEAHRQGIYEKYVKRPQDFFCALTAVVFLSPVMAITALLIRIKLGKPVLFRQQRPGLKEEIFYLYKFRTMTDEKNADGVLLPDEQRMTGLGKWLRATSLDELPELFNILKGDMAIIGPRPLLVKYLPLYDSRQHRRHDVRPGLSGLAQVHGRNEITWEKKFELDIIYVENISFCKDWEIVFMTLWKVLKREGIHEKGMATIEEFKGNTK